MFAQTALVAQMPSLQKFAFRLTKNKADAEDLVQSTCLRALEKSHYFQDGTNLFSWTSKIMFNLFVTDYRRKTKFETQYDPESFLEKLSTPPTQDIHSEFADMNRAMAKISPTHREILIMVCAKGMSYDEVSSVLQVPTGTVRSRVSRAREQLQIMMDTPPAQAKAQQLVRPAQNENIPLIPAYLAAREMQKIAHA